MSLLSVYYTPTLETPTPTFYSSNGTYRIPEITTYPSVIEYIKSLPLDTRPEIFNLHPNAEISKNQLETETFFKSVLSTQARTSDSGSGKSSEQVIIDLASDMLSKLPETIDIQLVSLKYPPNYAESMNTVLLQEIIRFRHLTDTIRDSLTNIQKAVKGIVVMSSELENTASSMLIGQIPKSWLSRSYPSVKPLAGYYQDFLARLSFFKKWVEKGPPIVFWLSGFFFTQSFLTGCLQNYARKYTIPIDLLAFEYHIQPTRTAQARPEEGQYINGLYLEGARWDPDQSTIAESQPRILFDSLPIIWLKPGEKSKFKIEGTYECPVYKTSARRGVLSTTGHSTNYVMSMRIPTNVGEDVWIRRGVAGLLALND